MSSDLHAILRKEDGNKREIFIYKRYSFHDTFLFDFFNCERVHIIVFALRINERTDNMN